jgi:hypothetical protein
MVYALPGKYPEALDESRKLVAIDPDFAIGYLQVAFNNVFPGNLDESDRVLKEAGARHLEIPELSAQRYMNAFLRGDTAGMERETARSGNNGDTEDWLAALDAFTLAYSLHLHRAQIQSRHAVDLARQGGRKERTALLEAGPAVREALFGNQLNAGRLAKDALNLSTGRDVEYAPFSRWPWGTIIRKPEGWRPISKNATRRIRSSNSIIFRQ